MKMNKMIRKSERERFGSARDWLGFGLANL